VAQILTGLKQAMVHIINRNKVLVFSRNQLSACLIRPRFEEWLLLLFSFVAIKFA